MRRQTTFSQQSEQQQLQQQQQSSSSPPRDLTPYNVMRWQNCKSFKFRKDEMYPSIKPPVFQCNPDKTIALLSDTMVANGCGPVDPTLLDQTQKNPYAQLLPKTTKSNSDEYPCRDKNRKLYGQVLEDPQLTEKWSKLTPNELIRMQNCKTYIYQKSETYPTIRPPLYKCNVAKTAEALVDALEDNCCDRHFDMEHDDILEVWKQIPHKNTLSFYGVGTGIPQPEAIIFNKVISKCLNKVNPPKIKTKVSRTQAVKIPRVSRPCGDLVLNRPLLSMKLSKMPTVKAKLNAKEALKYLHCPKPIITDTPFVDNPLKARLVKLPTSSSKRRYRYCDLSCGIPENKCTQLEWMKYKLDPTPYDRAFKLEMQETQELEEQFDPEPKNYDELYDELISCFENDKLLNPLCDIYKKFCLKHNRLDNIEGDADGGGRGGGRGGKKHDGGASGDGKEPKKPSWMDQNKWEEEQEKEKKKREEEENEDKDKTGKTGKKKSKDNLDGDESDDDGTGKIKKGKGKKKRKTVEGDEDDDEKTSKQKSEKEKSEKEKAEEEKKKEKSKHKDKDKDKGKHKDMTKDEKTGEKRKWTEGDYTDTEDIKTPKADSPINQTSAPPNDAPPEESPLTDTKKSEFDPPAVSKYKKGPKKPYKPFHGLDKPVPKVETFHKPRYQKPSDAQTHKTKKTYSQVEVKKDCPCEICEFMKRRVAEADTPLIREMKRKEKRRQLLDYYKQMCHRQNAKCAKPEYRAPLRKCDPIECDDNFCKNPKLAQYSDCLDAMYELQKLLGPKHPIVNNELVFNLEDLKRRISRRFCDCC